MPGRKAKLNSQKSQEPSQGSRFGFTIKKDIILLKSAIQHNPWQSGNEKWNDVVAELASTFEVSLTRRTVKTRIVTLLEKYKAEKLRSTTGTEEEVTTRGSLLDEIAGLVAESEASIDNLKGAENSQEFGILENECFTELELQEVGIGEKRDAQLNSNRLKEKKQADKERDEILKKNVAPEASGTRRKRALPVEDEMIIKKQDHDMAIEVRKMKMEEDRLELEKKKEHRKDEENRRRDDIQKSQLDIQQQMLQILANFTKK